MENLPTKSPVVSEIISPQAFEIKEKIASLQNAILTSHPTMPVLLRQIHTQIKNDPELVTLLKEEEIGIIVSGLMKQTTTEIASTTVKQASATASIKKKIQAAGSSAVDLF